MCLNESWSFKNFNVKENNPFWWQPECKIYCCAERPSSPGSSVKGEDPGDKVGNTPSLQDDRHHHHLVCSRATSGFTLPFHNRYFWSVGNFVFHKYENQKTIFSFNFTSSNTVSCRICYTWIALLSLKFLIAWILGGGNWKQKVKTTNWPFSIFSFWFSKYWRMMFNFTFLSNKNWKLSL